MQKRRRRDVPKGARAAPEGRNLRSRSEMAFPVWETFGPRSEGPNQKKKAPKKG